MALALREQIVDEVFDGSEALYWVLVCGVLAYAASYFARGWLAGHERFGLYGGLVLLESCSRLLFVLAVAVGIASGQTAVALGIAAAPLVSLVVMPWALRRSGRGRAAAEPVEDERGGSLRAGTGFAGAVLVIMAAEQALLNGPVVAVDATAADAALAGFVFNVLLISRAPLQLFQAIQTSLLPHLSGLEATGGRRQFDRAIAVTVAAIAAFAGLVALGLALIGPWAMDLIFGGDFAYGRWGLVLMAFGMGFHLVAGTLNQAALARGRAAWAAGTWLLAAALFLGWLALGPDRRSRAGGGGRLLRHHRAAGRRALRGLPPLSAPRLCFRHRPGMTVRRVMPDFQAEDPAASAAFYADVVGLEVVMDMGWIVTLAAPDNPAAQLSLMREDATAPVQPDVSIEVGDVDAAFAAAQHRGAEIVHPLTDEPWGVRRFFVRDPDGKVVNVLSHR